MAECPRCCSKYDDTAAFCGVCGTRLPGKEPILAPQADPLIGMVIDGRYKIIDLIGRGGMGAVYRVEHVKMGKIMAVKILHGELSREPEIAKRFKREAQTVSQLSHINTVSVFDFGSFQGMTYLVMEYIDGLDLAQAVRNEGRLPFERVARILIQVCAGLSEAHEKGIVHRDLKPENIIVSCKEEESDFVKVLDFGLAKLRDMQGKTRITAQGSIVGTPYYMAPEHIRGDKVDRRTDIYALGAVMYKLLTGETPFSGDTPMGVITKHLTEVPEAPSKRFPNFGIPAFADAIALKAMAKSPEDRYQSAEEMRHILLNAIKGEFEEPAHQPPVEESKPKPKGNPSWFGRLIAPMTGEWKMASTGQTEAISDPEKQALQQTDGADRKSRGSLAKSIIVGAREVEISTRSDFFQFESSLKRKKLVTLTAVLIAVAVALAAVLIVLVLK